VGPALTIATFPPASAQAWTSLNAEKTCTEVPTTSSRSDCEARSLAASALLFGSESPKKTTSLLVLVVVVMIVEVMMVEKVFE